MLPSLIHDSLTNPFNFYQENHIHQGIVCQDQMYALVKAFNKLQRSYAMALALKLSHQQVKALITVSPCSSHYRVWVGLKGGNCDLVQNLIAGNYPKDFQSELKEALPD